MKRVKIEFVCLKAAFSLIGSNPFDTVKKTLTVGDEKFQFYSLPDLNDKRYGEYAVIPV